jgi:site-specific recombinase XerD
MASLDSVGKKLVRESWAPRTLQTIEVGLKSFHRFLEQCEVSNVSQKAASPEDVIRYIAFLSILKKAPTTINTYVSAISTWHKMHKYVDRCEDFNVKRVIKGVAKGGRNPDGRAPITIELLRKLIRALKYVCDSDYEASMFKCVFLMAFFGLFRIGELVCDS